MIEYIKKSQFYFLFKKLIYFLYLTILAILYVNVMWWIAIFSQNFFVCIDKGWEIRKLTSKMVRPLQGGEARSHAPPPPIFQNLPKRRFNIESFPQCLSQNDMPKYVFAKVEFGFLSFLIKTLIMWTKFWEHITFFGKTGMNIKSGQDMKIIHISIANNM